MPADFSLICFDASFLFATSEQFKNKSLLNVDSTFSYQFFQTVEFVIIGNFSLEHVVH